MTQLLGRPFALVGPVVPGETRGQTLGFPTANIAVNHNQALPPDGVYVTRAYLGEQSHPSVTNIGRRPTFGPGERAIEVFLLDFSGHLYGRELRLELLERLREEKAFASPGELQAQIARDVERARALFYDQNRMRGHAP